MTALDKRPIAVKSATSFFGFMIGDLLAQTITGHGAYDVFRTLRLVSISYLKPVYAQRCLVLVENVCTTLGGAQICLQMLTNACLIHESPPCRSGLPCSAHTSSQNRATMPSYHTHLDPAIFDNPNDLA